jgi:hypothetical protein
MKIRQGFVSNSSSSSFCLIGTEDASLIEAVSANLKVPKIPFTTYVFF